ncbi:heavy-metal-associated domain-containing protein [Hymenobacter tibetensis]|uniref:Heavy-metal-associated domain-containing protein n=1 Tax=Hymenobacter tibetensis TaxID=497967 RepID=A0ABY4D1V1_9BACT|nr:heavy metal-associated domain-containing protein [Hymenobacter tibetensis]UOG76312.1 heavy-metal-associated domain-containing protein [Hymenobacter tibetensis]
MKSVKIFLLALLTLLTAQVAQAQTASKAKSQAAGTEQVQLKTSAVCDMCKTRLEKAMAYEKGVQAAVLDVPTQVLTVTYRPEKTTPEALRTAVQKTGYDADAQPADERAYNKLPDCCKKTNAVHTKEGSR